MCTGPWQPSSPTLPPVWTETPGRGGHGYPWRLNCKAERGLMWGLKQKSLIFIRSNNEWHSQPVLYSRDRFFEKPITECWRPGPLWGSQPGTSKQGPDRWMDWVTCAFSGLRGEKVQPAPPACSLLGSGMFRWGEVPGGSWSRAWVASLCVCPAGAGW